MLRAGVLPLLLLDTASSAWRGRRRRDVVRRDALVRGLLHDGVDVPLPRRAAAASTRAASLTVAPAGACTADCGPSLPPTRRSGQTTPTSNDIGDSGSSEGRLPASTGCSPTREGGRGARRTAGPGRFPVCADDGDGSCDGDLGASVSSGVSVSRFPGRPDVFRSPSSLQSRACDDGGFEGLVSSSSCVGEFIDDLAAPVTTAAPAPRPTRGGRYGRRGRRGRAVP